MSVKKLVVIGAGPKAMAIATKNAVLSELGFSVPEIHIVEKAEVGAHWTGKNGYTNGRLLLTSAPEKDVGFPYDSNTWADANPTLNLKMRDFSWTTYLVDTRRYADWIDRGKPAPEHRQWAWYLQWVWERIKDRAICHQGEVIGLEAAGNQWQVTYRQSNGEPSQITCDGVVVTGPGRTKLQSRLPVHDRLLTPENFWRNHQRILSEKNLRIALVGTGENTAAIAMSLAQSEAEGHRIDIFSPNGMPFSRSESFLDSRVFSNPERGSWQKLTEQDRLNFIYTADRGVFSVDAQEVLDRTACLHIVPGKLIDVEAAANNTLDLISEYNGQREVTNYDYIVVSTGADPLSFLVEVMPESTREHVLRGVGLAEISERAVQRKIDSSLAVEGLSPRLHLPMLSGLNQGPGFATLSSLGRLSDRILADYVTR